MLFRRHGKIRTVLWLITLAALLYVVIVHSNITGGRYASSRTSERSSIRSRQIVVSGTGRHKVNTSAKRTIRPLPKRYYSKDNSTDVMDGNQTRRHLTLRQGCEKLGMGYPRGVSEIQLRKNLIYDRKHTVVYCDIPLFGSSAIYRTMQLLASANPIHPFKALDRTDSIILRTFEELSFHKAVKILNEGVKFLFTQNPYTSLLYFYLRTLYVNNRRLWYNREGWEPTDHESEKCRKPLNFGEFIEIFIQSSTPSRTRFWVDDGRISYYWTSSFESCNPCDITYDYIGKMENLDEEIKSILSPSHFSDLVDMKSLIETRTQELMEPIVAQATDSRPESVQCMSHREALLKGWTALQIMAVIPEDKKFPFDVNVPIISVSKQNFLQQVNTARNSANWTAAKHPMVLMREKYSQLPKVTIQKLKTLLFPELLLFGYDTNPVQYSTNDTAKNA